MNLKKLFIFFLFIIPLISIAQPRASFDKSTSILCQGDDIELTNTSTFDVDDKIVNLHWFFGDGSDTWSRENPVHRYDTVKTYTIKLIVISANGNRDSTTQQISIVEKTAVQISVEPNSNIINLGEKASLSVDNNFTDYLWSTNEVTSSIDVYKEAYYWVQVHDNNGCFNADTVFIAVIQEDMSVSSNILTPNNDGYNDYLEITDIEKYNFPIHLYIYNIRNELIYESSEYKGDWSGDNYPAGSYFYLLKTDDRRDKAGTINILR